MNFVYPQFLFALLAISIPVIIHLFNFRRFKKVYFSDIRFLKDVKIQTQNRNKLKHLLILLSRILAVSFLVFAFAQPFIPSTDKKFNAGTKAISVYVDNSYSMENVSKNGILIDEAKKIAHEIALVDAAEEERADAPGCGRRREGLRAAAGRLHSDSHGRARRGRDLNATGRGTT